MRLYTFTHFMLSSIQQGIQSGHASQAVINKHIDDRKTSKELQAIKQWLPSPTIICLNGGNTAELNKIAEKLSLIGPALHLPWSCFYEDAESMAQLMTSVGIIVPERIYESALIIRIRAPGFESMLPQDLHPTEIELAELLNKYQLAR